MLESNAAARSAFSALVGRRLDEEVVVEEVDVTPLMLALCPWPRLEDEEGGGGGRMVLVVGNDEESGVIPPPVPPLLLECPE